MRILHCLFLIGLLTRQRKERYHLASGFFLVPSIGFQASLFPFVATLLFTNIFSPRVLGCRTLTLQGILQLPTVPTWAALPVPFLLTRPRASPWRARTTWVGTHELLRHSDLTSQQLLVPMILHLLSFSSPLSLPTRIKLWVGGGGRECMCHNWHQ